MYKNIFIVIIVLATSSLLEPIYMLYLLLFNCILSIIIAVIEKKELINVLNFMYIGVANVTYGNIYLLDVYDTPKNVIYHYLQKQYISDSVQIWVLGCLFILIGIDLFAKNSLPNISLNLNKKYYNYFYIILFFFIFISVFKVANFLGSIGKITSLAGNFGLLFFTIRWQIEKNRTYFLYAVSLYVFATLMALSFSYLRAASILPSIIFIIGIVIGSKSIFTLVSYKFLPVYIFLFVFLSAYSDIGKYRSTQSIISILINKQFNAEQNTRKLLGLKNENEIKEEGTLTERNANLAQISQIVRLTKKNGFYNGSVSSILLVSLIPRFLWADKPLIELGTWFALESGIGYQENKATRVNNSVNMTIMGQLYLDFGINGVMIGCLLVGSMLIILFNSTNFNSMENNNITGVIFGGYILFDVLQGIGSDLQITITFISYYLLFFIIKKIFAR